MLIMFSQLRKHESMAKLKDGDFMFQVRYRPVRVHLEKYSPSAVAPERAPSTPTRSDFAFLHGMGVMQGKRVARIV
jgi:hypothetical protein